MKPPRGASVCRTRADTFSGRDSLLERLLTKNDFKGTTYFSVGFLQLELIEFQKFLPVLAFDEIEDFFVSEIDAVVEIATPEHVVVGKNVLSLRCRENGDHSARLAGRAGEGRKSHGWGRGGNPTGADALLLKCYLKGLIFHLSPKPTEELLHGLHFKF